jgi:hypothetical protein
MTWSDGPRRILGVLAAVAILVLAPTGAGAQFGSNATRALPVTTDQMETPTAVVGDYECQLSNDDDKERLQVDLDSFVEASPTPTSYRYVITRSGTVVLDRTLTAKNRTFNAPYVDVDNVVTTWTFSITTVRNQWTGVPWTRTIICPATGESSGSL